MRAMFRIVKIHFENIIWRFVLVLSPQKKGKHVFSTADKILEYLRNSGGESSFNDKSSPEDIKKEFQISKMVFKQAIGKLYKQGKIKITDQGIELVK